jgi:hypothetical protein
VKNRRELGMALATSLLVLLLVSAMIVGLSWLVMTDQKLGGNNGDRQVAFYGAEAGMESLTAAIANAFNANYNLSAADITNIMTTPPATIPGIQYLNPNGTNGYEIAFTPISGANPNPAATTHTILSGTYAGLVGLLTPYTLTVTARTAYGSEVKMQRLVQTVAIPVFQFGIFSQTDLAFFAGPNFNFGGRVHTNGNLWLAEGSGSTLTMANKVTSAKEIIVSNLENGWPTATNYTGTVDVTENPGSGLYGALGPTQGSVTGPSVYGAVSGALNEPTFANLASGTYNGNIGVKETGVNPLNLTIALPNIGGQSIDLIRLALPGENTTNPAKLSERYYSQTSVRILLSDYGASGTCTDSDIVSLPLISGGTPLDLATLAWDPAGPVTAHPAWIPNASVGVSVFPLPTSDASAAAYTASDGNWIKAHYPTITGCIKIDYQVAAGGSFTDVTQEILKLGWTGRQLYSPGGAFIAPPLVPPLPGAQVGPSGCADPSPNAVIRLARLRDNASDAVACTPTTLATDYWPNVLFDPREANLRDFAMPGNVLTLAGGMYYVELDTNNLARWFTGAIGASGALAYNVTGYSLYFSDRRGDRYDPNPPASIGGANVKTGAFGFDDIVNAGSALGCPDGALGQGEDLEGDYDATITDTNPILRTYGQTPSFGGGALPITNLTPLSNVPNAALQNNPNCTAMGLTWPYAALLNAQDLRENPPIIFRRALKLVNGSTLTIGTCNAVPCGLTVVAENPAYLQGDYNAQPNGNFGGAHVAASLIADAVTLLSDNWNDVNSFAFPYNTGGRGGVTTTYRLAIAAGKGIPFTQPTVGGVYQDYGTDGGTHNFLRYIEAWNGTLYYEGSIVSLYFNHQAMGTYKCCTTVYSPPTRGYNFDTDFLTPSLLPPETPMFRDLNTITAQQMILPTQ